MKEKEVIYLKYYFKWSGTPTVGEDEACRRGEEEGDPLSREGKGERGERRDKLVKILRMRES